MVDRGSATPTGNGTPTPARRRQVASSPIKGVELDDDTATATVTAPGGVESEVELRKVAGRWLIADF